MLYNIYLYLQHVKIRNHNKVAAAMKLEFTTCVFSDLDI